MEFSIDGQTAVVVGGTTGIGRAISETLAEAGATVVPTSRNEDNVAEAADVVGCDLVFTTDVTERTQVKRLFERVTETYDEFSILVNCAGYIQESTPLPNISNENWQKILDVNVSGMFYASQLAPSHFSGENKSIINVGSMSEETVLPGMAPYAASKAAIRKFAENLAVEYASKGIRVNTVAPGYVETRQTEDLLGNPEVQDALHNETPLGRYAKREDVANAVLYLVSPLASFVTGETIRIDGGFSLT